MLSSLLVSVVGTKVFRQGNRLREVKRLSAYPILKPRPFWPQSALQLCCTAHPSILKKRKNETHRKVGRHGFRVAVSKGSLGCRCLGGDCCTLWEL